MFRIDYRSFKAPFSTNERKIFTKKLAPSIGVELFQYEVKALEAFKSIFIDLKKAFESMVDFDCYCFYCGDRTRNIVPGFLHNGSGVNLWMYSDIKCSSVICDECNMYSGKNSIQYQRKFSNITAGKVTEVLKFEPNILIPNLEPVHLHFKYKNDGKLEPLSLRAKKTIEVFSLNRERLVQRRIDSIKSSRLLSNINEKAQIQSIPSPIDFLFSLEDKKERGLKNSSSTDFESLEKNCIETIHKETPIYPSSENIEFLKIQRYPNICFKRLGNDIKNKQLPKNEFIGLDSITFSDLRGFNTKQKIQFKGRDSLIIIGENGVGKSTLLKLIKKAVKPKVNLSMRDLVQGDDISPYFHVKYNQINKEFKYGEINKERSGVKSPCNLIEISESRVSLTNINAFINWVNINSQDTELINWVARQLKLLLDINPTYTLVTQDKNIYWSDPSDSSVKLYLEHLSSGYRSIITIFHSIVKSLTSFDYYGETRLPVINNSLSSTIVLIDEIELHLHPVFKKHIVERLQSAFPEILFVMTTHDPLILKSSSMNTSVLVLEKEEGKTVIRSELPKHQYMSTEQILTSPIFGLETVSHSTEKSEKVRKYKEALKLKNWETVDKLRDELSEVGLFGNTYREYIALSAVDAYVAKNIAPTVQDIEDFLKDIEEGNDA